MNHKNRNRNWTSLLLSLLFVVGLLSSIPVPAATQATMTPGDHQLLRVKEVGARPDHAPTSLEWSLLGDRGRKIEGVIPGTGGPDFDAYPSLFNDTDTGAPVLVWSRHNGMDYDIAFSRFEEGSWTPPITLVDTTRDEIQPRAYSTSGGEFHLVWNWPGDSGNFLYGRFSLETGVTVLEPERIIAQLGPKEDEQWISTSPEGGMDDPGTGHSGGNDNFNCEDGERCPCDYGGQCAGTSPSVEGATVCESFSLVVGSGRKACLLSRTPDGWALGTCQEFRGGAGARELLISLGKLQNTGCL